MKLSNLAFILVVIALTLEVLGEIFPNTIPRFIIAWIVSPVILMYYYVNTYKEHYLYMGSFLFSLLGAYYYNIASDNQNAIGILFYSIQIYIYIYIIADTFKKFSFKNFLCYGMPLILVFVATIYFFLGARNDWVFYMSSFYGILNVIYLFCTIVNFINQKSKASTYLLYSGILLAISSILSAYVYNQQVLIKVRVIEVLFYSLSLFFMSKYMIERSKKTELTKSSYNTI